MPLLGFGTIAGQHLSIHCMSQKNLGLRTWAMGTGMQRKPHTTMSGLWT